MIFCIQEAGTAGGVARRENRFDGSTAQIDHISVINRMPRIAALSGMIGHQFQQFFLIQIRAANRPTRLNIETAHLVVICGAHEFFHILVIFFGTLPIQRIHIDWNAGKLKDTAVMVKVCMRQQNDQRLIRQCTHFPSEVADTAAGIHQRGFLFTLDEESVHQTKFTQAPCMGRDFGDLMSIHRQNRLLSCMC